MVVMPNARFLQTALLVALLAAACTSSAGNGTSGEARSAVPATNATTAPLLPTDAEALPAFDYTKFQELLGQLRGTPVVVNIWGSWCGPCRDEAPLFARAARTYGDRVQFIGVDILDVRSSARDFMREFDWTYPSVFDPSPGGDIRNRLGYIGQPDTIFYDAAGRKVFDWEGAIPSDRLNAGIDKILP